MVFGSPLHTLEGVFKNIISLMAVNEELVILSYYPQMDVKLIFLSLFCQLTTSGAIFETIDAIGFPVLRS